MRYTCIQIEDEPLAVKRLKGLVERVPFLQYFAHYENALDGLEHIRANHTDIIFLDVQLDDISGIEFLKSTNISAQVILTTAHRDYALEGYSLNVTDYLLKPFSFDRFLQAVNKANEHLLKNTNPPKKDYLFIKTENRLLKIDIRDILYIEGMRDYRCIHLVDKRIMTLSTFKELEKRIPEHRVCRVHKSYMVALEKIDQIQSGRIKIGDKYLPISESYRKQFLAYVTS